MGTAVLLDTHPPCSAQTRWRLAPPTVTRDAPHPGVCVWGSQRVLLPSSATTAKPSQCLNCRLQRNLPEPHCVGRPGRPGTVSGTTHPLSAQAREDQHWPGPR